MPDYRTTHPGAKAGLSSLRTGVSCVLRAAVICVLACITLLMIPVNVYVNFSGVFIGGNHAFADDEETPPLPEPPRPSGPALTYLDLLANQAQMDTSQFVATTICALGASTGMIMAANGGVKLIDGNLYDNLDALVDAADYPAWNTLTYEEQMEYGNKQDYDATKYLSLMDAFDLSSGYERYQDSLSSGGSDFSFNEGETSVLHKLGRIGSNWINGIGQSVNDIKECLNPNYKEMLYKYLHGSSQSPGGAELQWNGEGVEDWTGGTVFYKLTDVAWTEYPSSSGRIWYNKTQSISDVYFILCKRGSTVTTFMISKAPFNWGTFGGWSVETVPTMDSAATLKSNVPDKPFYYASTSVSYKSNMTGSQSIYADGYAITDTVLANILYGAGSSSGGGTGELHPDIPDYPTEQEVPATQVVYYPIGGITPSTTWNQYTTVQRPSNPYNPDDQTSTPEWKQETKQNIQGLQAIHFEKLFPFSMMFSIPELVNVVRNGVTSNEGVPKTQISIPFKWSVTGSSAIVLDLTDLANMLVLVRPFNRVLLVFSLLLALVMFWKSILTGD